MSVCHHTLIQAFGYLVMAELRNIHKYLARTTAWMLIMPVVNQQSETITLHLGDSSFDVEPEFFISMSYVYSMFLQDWHQE